MVSLNLTIKAVLFICWAWFYGGSVVASQAACPVMASCPNHCYDHGLDGYPPPHPRDYYSETLMQVIDLNVEVEPNCYYFLLVFLGASF